MKITENGIEYSEREHIDITNKGEKILKKHRSTGKCMFDGCFMDSINSHTVGRLHFKFYIYCI